MKAKLADYISQDSNQDTSSKGRTPSLKFGDGQTQEAIRAIKMRNSARKMVTCLEKLDLSLPASTIYDAFINLKRNSRAQASIVKSLSKPALSMASRSSSVEMLPESSVYGSSAYTESEAPKKLRKRSYLTSNKNESDPKPPIPSNTK